MVGKSFIKAPGIKIKSSLNLFSFESPSSVSIPVVVLHCFVTQIISEIIVIAKNMKHAYVLLFVLTICGLAMGNEDEYPTIYDKIDVDTILSSERLSNQYIQCLLEKGPCTADGRSLKQILPEALATRCVKCNDRQKEIARKICTYLKEKNPNAWVLFTEKYDPENKYLEKFEEFLKEN
ncbi:hypothetical protein KPH14_005822 [Odynerus spinipes]|uniref:Uncharacterized protein n=1 Tax=Odynerus spinipes TaxID=1348599 RepID=A0AAD9VIZ2_9HYME|nr:hypothetical protein KPH14_005822 [Odynerus spinipes]